MDNIKATLEQSEGEDDSIIADMMELRLVNRHWSLWATRAIGVLRPSNVPLEKLLKMVAERFVNVRSLKLGNIEKINDEDLVTLCKLSTLTILDVTRSRCGLRGNYRQGC